MLQKTTRLHTSWTKRDYLRAVLLAVLAGGLIVYSAWRTNGGSDLVGFHKSCAHWLATGSFEPFGIRFYLPALTILILPVAGWRLPIAGALLAAINIVMLVLAVRESSRNTQEQLGLEDQPCRFRWLTLLLAAPYALDTIALGQLNLIVLWLSLAAYTREKKGCPWLAGGLLGLAGVVKLFPLLLLVHWLIRGRLRAVLWTLFAFVMLSVVPSLIAFGWEGSLQAHRRWAAHLRGVSPKESAGEQSFVPGNMIFADRLNEEHRHNNQSLAVVIRRLTTRLFPEADHPSDVHIVSLTPRQAYCLYSLVAGVVFAIIALADYRNRGSPEDFAGWAVWLAAIIAFTPIYWTHYFVLTLPALMLLVANGCRLTDEHKRDMVRIVLVFGWLAGFVMLGSTRLRLIGVHCWLTLALTMWLVTRYSGSEVRKLSTNEAQMPK